MSSFGEADTMVLLRPMAHPNASSKRSSGRPRSEPVRVAIIAATMRLLESSTLQDISIEAIAKASGVSKATIYRWWPSKLAVVLDGFIEYHVVHTPIPRKVSVREALAKHMSLLIGQYAGLPGRIVAQIIAAGQSDPDVLREFRERFFYGRRAAVRELLNEGRASGELRADLDIEFMMDVLYSPIYFRLMMGHLPLDDDFAKHLPTALFEVIEARPKNTATPSPSMSKIRGGIATERVAKRKVA